MENTVTRAEMEEYFAREIDSRLKQAVEEFLISNETRIKEFSILERIIRVEEELKAMREMSEVKFEAMEKRFETMDKRFEALLREMNARFEVVDKRFEAVDKRFETMDKRFSVIQWMIGLFVGIPALIIALTRVLEVLN